jgi:hypothetical protein
MSETLPYSAYAVLCAGLLVWTNARTGSDELWRVAFLLCAITGAHAGLVWMFQTWILPELTPGVTACRLAVDPRRVPLATMSSGLAVAACDALGMSRPVQLLLAAAVGWLVLLSSLGLPLSATVPGTP